MRTDAGWKKRQTTRQMAGKFSTTGSSTVSQQDRHLNRLDIQKLIQTCHLALQYPPAPIR